MTASLNDSKVVGKILDSVQNTHHIHLDSPSLMKKYRNHAAIVFLFNMQEIYHKCRLKEQYSFREKLKNKIHALWKKNSNTVIDDQESLKTDRYLYFL